MSLGNTYNNNQGSNKNDSNITVYSNYRMNNAESLIDQTCLTFRYWKQSLCIGIFPRKQTGNENDIAFDMDNGITIYLSHTKARILKAEIENFLRDPVAYNGSGVPSGQAAITISNGLEYGKNTPVLTIRKVDGETGNILSSFAYEFKTNFHYSIRHYDGKNFDTEYDDYRNIEIQQMITVLDEYIKASTNAIAFTVRDQSKFAESRTFNTLNAIAEKLGVELRGNSNGAKRFNNSSYFNNSGSNNNNSGYSSPSAVAYGTATIDDLE